MLTNATDMFAIHCFQGNWVFFLSSLQTTQVKSLFILTICVKHYEYALEL